MLQLPDALAAFAAYHQFIVYKSVPSVSRPGKTDKFPCDHRTGKVVSAHDSSYWMDAQTALATGQPIGFVFTENDPFWFADIDGCLVDGKWSPIAEQLCGVFAGCAIEVSQSGSGLHIFGTGAIPPHGCRNSAYGLELYHAGRFVALTGTNAVGNAAFDASAVLPAVVQTYFPADTGAGEALGWTESPDPAWYGPSDDADLIRRAMLSGGAASKFGTKAAFADLWLANTDKLRLAYPDPARDYDASAADAALAQHLAFWTGKDCARILRLMEGSKLARDKWNREDYLPRTITGAVSRQIDVLQDKRPEAPAPASGSAVGAPSVIQGVRIANIDTQMSLFAGCIYVKSAKSVFCAKWGFADRDQFRALFGGYQFQVDLLNEKLGKDPWEAFTSSQVIEWPKVTSTCFRPALPTGEIVWRDGKSYVNTYVPIEVPRKAGDASPFLSHLAKLLPNQEDRDILLAYMAFVVQYKGVKAQWAPLIQGVEGNGKTLFSRCVEQAVGRSYSHFPPANEISEKFNSWLFDTIFIGVEDIYVPNQKQEVFEILKPMITSDYLANRAMQREQVMREVVCNFIFNTNHKDGLRKTRNDRRICILFTAQQEHKDLERDGMTGDYFPALYRWLNGGGYAIVTDYLMTYAIPAKYNPATECQRAPHTSTTNEAIDAGMGGLEQEILECIAQGLPGFCGGWISSIWLDRLFERLRRGQNLSHTKRRQMLKDMGYDYHPAFTAGRTNNVVMPDGSKPRLFIHETSLARQITNANEAAKDYERANSGRVIVGLPFGQAPAAVR